MIDKIKSALAQKGLSGWQIRETRTRSDQSFLAKTDRECDRTVDRISYSVAIHKRRRGPDGKDVLGLAQFRLGESDEATVRQMLDQAVYAADLVSNQPFELPEPPKTVPDVEIADVEAGPAALKVCEERLLAALAREKGIRLSAAEFFVDRVETRLLNHKGLDLNQSETMLHTEFILLARAAERENEYITRYSRRFLRDFDLESEAANSARLAREATQAGLPKTGSFPVLLSEEPLDSLFNPLIARASARLKYNRMVDSEIGKSVAEAGEAKGDRISLWSNSVLPRAAGSSRFDSFGTPADRVCLIEKNMVKRYLADKRYADYLHVPVTGEMGNVEVEPGSASFDQLTDAARAPAGTLYHLIAFSAFEPNTITGAFSAEIRAGYEITSAGVRPIKGGSVSGVLQRDILDCRLSRESVQREHSLVPKGVLFSSLTIAGE